MATTEEVTKTRPSPPGHAGVVGAGIAGLSAAIALRRAGWHVDVFERSQFKNETGAAITVTPNAALVLDRWGFDMAKAEAVPNQSKIMGLAGRPMIIIDKQEYADDASGLGYGVCSLHRVDLHRELRRLATMPVMPRADSIAGPPAQIRLGDAVEGVDCEQGVLTLASGHKVTKDLVIIADGAHVS
jgi:salicylate hydroxylase